MPARLRPFGRRPRVEPLEQRRLLAVNLFGVPQWDEQGPGPIENGQVTAAPNDAVSGAVESIAVVDDDTVFVGSVAGGVWRTDSFSAASPTWEPLSDDLGSLYVGSIAFDPSDGDTLYVGTGSYSNTFRNRLGDMAVGIYRTTNAHEADPDDVNWELLGGSTFAGLSIRSVVPTTDPDVILVAAATGGGSGGVFRSDDAGQTWDEITDGARLPSSSATDLIADPNDNQRFYAALPGTGVYLTQDRGVSWDQIDNQNTAIAGIAGSDNIELAVHDGGTTSVLYAGIVDDNGDISGVFRDEDGGDGVDNDTANGTDDPGEYDWAVVGTTGAIASTTVATAANPIRVTSNAHGLSTGNKVSIAGVAGHAGALGYFTITVINANEFDLDGTDGTDPAPGGPGTGGTWTLVPGIHDGSQGFNNFAIEADPTDDEVVYVGGDRPPHVFRGDAGANTWTSIVEGGTASNTTPHADTRDIVFLDNTTLLEADDGGIFQISTPLNAAANDWVNKNGDMRDVEFHSIEFDTSANLIFGGSQDNGSEVQKAVGSQVWDHFKGGDGSTQTYDANANVRYSLGNHFGTFVRNGVTQLQLRAPAGVADFDGLEDTSGGRTDRDFAGGGGFESFLPVVANRFTADRILLARRSLYESTNAGDNITTINLPGKGATDVVRSLAFGGTRNGTDEPDIFYAGTDAGRFYVRDETSTIFDRTAQLSADVPGSGFVKGIAVDPQDWHHIVIVTANRVAESTDAGASWTDITGNLGTLTSELRRIALVDLSDEPGDGVPVVGGLGGVFRNLDGEWSEFGTAMPNTLVHDLKFVDVDLDGWSGDGEGLLLAGTFGRGAWTIEDVTATIEDDGVLVVCGDEDHVNQDDVIRLVRNQANPDMLDVFINNTTATPDATYALASITQINVFGIGGNDELIVDTTNGLIAVPDGIRYNGDGACFIDEPNDIPENGFDNGDGHSHEFGYDRGFDTLTITTDDTDTDFTDEELAVGQLPGSGRHTIFDTDGDQVIWFEELEPVTTNVVAANFNITSIAGLASLLQDDNQINYEQGQILGASAGRVTVDNFEPIEFINKDNLTIDAGAGSDLTNLNNPTTPTGATPNGLKTITVNGDDPTAGSDQVIVNGTSAKETFTVTLVDEDDATVAITGLPMVTADTTELLSINGQGGDDDLIVFTPSGGSGNAITLTPGATPDAGTIEARTLGLTGRPLIPLRFTDLQAGGTLAFSNTDGRTDTLDFLGTDSSDRFDVSSTGIVQLFDGDPPSTVFATVPVSTAGIGTLNLRGLAGDDLFEATAVLPFTRVFVDGGSPDASDELNLAGDAAIQAITVDLEDSEITGFGGTVSFAGLEHVDLDGGGGAGVDTLTVDGTEVDDQLTYTPTDTNEGAFQREGDNTVFTFDRIEGTFTVNGLGDTADEVIVMGTNNHDVITVDSPNRNVTVENAAGTVLKRVALGNSVELATVKAGMGSDTVLVVPAPSVLPVPIGDLPRNLLVHVDGGPPSASDALVIAGTTAGGPLPATDFVVVNRSRRFDEGTVRVFRSAGAMPDISYTDVEVVSPLVDPVNSDTGDPQLLILGPDLYEQNEFRATAAFLGSGDVINVENLAIFPNAHEHDFVPQDQDYYRVVAETTGTLDFQVYFRMFDPGLLPGGGNLNIEALDEDGTVIAGTVATNFGTADLTPNARLRIPAVAGQTYYLRVFGVDVPVEPNDNGDLEGLVVNGYDMTIINTPPPVPYDLELDDLPPGDDTINDIPSNSDTGRSQFDNITRDNQPEIFFRLDDDIFHFDLPGNPAADSPPDEVIPIPLNTDQTRDTTTAGYRVAIFDEGDPQQPVQLPQEPIGYARLHVDGVYVFDFSTDAIDPALPNGPTTSYTLTDGSHFLSAKVQMVDPADPTQTGFGPRSESLEIVVDTLQPPVFFGEDPAVDPFATDDGLHPDSDTGIEDQQTTFTDRITSDTTPTFWGIAEADAIIRLFVDLNGDKLLDPAVDLFIAETVAIPLDGTNQFPRGQWIATTNIDMNDLDYFTIDGLRTVFVTAEDVAGNITDNENEYDTLDIFIDTRGPQVHDVYIAGYEDYDLFDPKPSTDGPTPLVFELDIDLFDRPRRLAPDFVYPAANWILATQPGNIQLVGDHWGNIPIKDIEFFDFTTSGDFGRSTVRLEFFEPLPDDRFTLIVSDRIKDDAGNALDGESNAHEPQEIPDLPSGDGDPGEDFVARFTVDSRPEIADWSAGSVYVDINGNFLFDPQNEDQNQDYTNRDITFQYGFTTDDIFAGKFTDIDWQPPHDGGEVYALNGDPKAVPLFDKLGAYGRVDGQFRWLIDTDNDGVADVNVTGVTDQGIETPGVIDPMGINGLPVAGNFDGIPLNGDEVGLFTGDTWWFDTTHNYNVDTPLASALTGYPIVGDFDGDGLDDLGAWTDDRFQFDLSSVGATLIPTLPGLDGAIDAQIEFGFIGVRERPVAADMDQDGIDDIGLWVPDRSGQTPEEGAEWYFLISDDRLHLKRAAGTVAALDHPFEPVPFGADLFAQFGDDYALPVVGNFDPPVADDGSGNPDPETLLVAGTDGDDTIEITAGATPDAWLVTLNGVPVAPGPQTVNVEFDGRGGTDTISITGTSGDDVLQLWADHGTMAGDGYTISFANVEWVGVEGEAGADEATFHDAAGSDELFIGFVGGGQMTSEAMANYAAGFETVVAFSSKDPGDVARFYDSPGNDEFIATPQYGQMTGDGFSMKAIGFDGVHGFATAGGFDYAKMFDSAGDDHFFGSGIEASLYGDGFYNRAKHFEQTHAYATAGGYDMVLLRDTAGDDTFFADPIEGVLYGEGYLNRGKHFEAVYAEADGGGHDVAYLEDSAGDDLLTTGPVYAELSGDTFKNVGTNFDEVYAQASEGYDLARMFDSPGDDEFNTTAIYGALSGDGFHNQAEDFDSVNAYANAGGHDVAKMFDSAGDEIFYGTPTESSLYQLGLFHHRAVSFEEVHAYATAGGFDQADLVGSVQDDTLYATSVEQVLYNDDFLIRAKHFEEVRSHTDQGGVDKAYVVGAVLEAQSRAPDAARSDATSAKVAWLFDFEEVYDLDEPGDDLDEPVVDDVFAYWPA